MLNGFSALFKRLRFLASCSLTIGVLAAIIVFSSGGLLILINALPYPLGAVIFWVMWPLFWIWRDWREHA